MKHDREFLLKKNEVFHVFPPEQGCLYVVVPSLGRLRNLLTRRRSEGRLFLLSEAPTRTYLAGGVALTARRLITEGLVKPVWHATFGSIDEGAAALVLGGVFRTTEEAKDARGDIFYGRKTSYQWFTGRGFTFQKSDVAFVWWNGDPEEAAPLRFLVSRGGELRGAPETWPKAHAPSFGA